MHEESDDEGYVQTKEEYEQHVLDLVLTSVSQRALLEYSVQVLKVKAFLQMCVARRRFLQQK